MLEKDWFRNCLFGQKVILMHMSFWKLWSIIKQLLVLNGKVFLVNIQMPQEDIVALFAKAPNYDERITRYHVDNISGKHSGKKYSAPSCAKVREHSLCISRTCNVMHPMQFYERESNPSTSRKEKKEVAIPNEPQNPAGSTITQ